LKIKALEFLSDFQNRGKNLKANQIKALRFDAILKIKVKISKLMKSRLCVLARFSKSR
jgi:hypothetical protein